MCSRFSRSGPPSRRSPGPYCRISTPASLTNSLATGSTIPATRTCRAPWFQYRRQAAAPVFVGDRAPARPPLVGEATPRWMLTYVARLRRGFARVSRVGGTVAAWTAALRAGFATVAEHYERVLRTLQALGIEIGINPHDIGYATDPEWGPATLLAYGDERFLKHEQTVIDQLLHKLP